MLDIVQYNKFVRQKRCPLSQPKNTQTQFIESFVFVKLSCKKSLVDIFSIPVNIWESTKYMEILLFCL